MNVVIRRVLTRQSFRLCETLACKTLSKHIPITSTCPVIQLRNYCQGQERLEAETRKLPQLMEFPPVVWPSFIKFIKNWMFANFIIRPYFDQEFSLHEFIEGSKHAVQVFKIMFTYSESYLNISTPINCSYYHDLFITSYHSLKAYYLCFYCAIVINNFIIE